MAVRRIAKILLPLSWVFLIVTTYWCIQGHQQDRWNTQFGFGAVAVTYAIRYWNKSSIRSTDTLKCLLVVFWCVIKITFAHRMTFDRIVFYSFYVLGLVWLVFEIIDLIKGRTKGHRLVLLLGALLLALQMLCRYMWWPGAGSLTVLAFFVLSIGFIAELVLVFQQKREAQEKKVK